MNSLLQPNESPFQLKLEGKMTYEFYRELEDRVIDAMRRYKNLEVDLSEVSEIDLCGIHLIGLLQSAGRIVAVSPVVEEASKRLFTTLHAAALGRAKRSYRGNPSPVSEMRTK
ncbi:STAS domain-containing protein [Propionivibrio sp.]|uniref:STAS domain-containing protein n=1 Tax=Propionivibrio sp. TaxID=2212460 RepID=UPI003BF2AF0D